MSTMAAVEILGILNHISELYEIRAEKVVPPVGGTYTRYTLVRRDTDGKAMGGETSD